MNEVLYLLLINVLFAFGQDSKEDKDQCGQKEFYDPQGSIKSPGFPGNYPDNSNCFYRILTNRMINLQFDLFSIEESQDCQYDNLNVIFNASSSTAAPQRYCGDGLGKINGGVLRGQGPLIIGFKSDESDNLNGFSFSFEFELNGPDPCLSEPCQNGGNCSTYPGYYTCDCMDGYAGVNCEIDKDECLSYPCQNNGVCLDHLNGFTCECLNGFTGELCEIKPELCSSDPCLNGGLCVERGVDYVCSCPRDFMGDHCESPVPTPPPKITTPPATTPAHFTPATNTSTEPEPPDYDDQPLEDGANRNYQNPPSGSQPKEENTNEGNSIVIVIAVVASSLILLLGGVLGWYCWKKSRGNGGVALTKEVTLINMKTKSEREKGKAGRRLSRTMSFNSVTMKGDANDNFLNHIHKMSEDVIMEEVTDDSGSSVTKPLAPPVLNGNLPAIRVDESLDTSRPAATNQLSIPVTKTKLQRATANDLNKSEAIRRATQIEPLHISPEDAVKLLNQMKQQRENDGRTALEQYGYSSYPKNPFEPVTKSQGKLQDAYDAYQLPNVPIPTSHNQNRCGDHEMIELSPEEAAEVMNHFLHTNSSPRKDVDSREAMSFIQEVTNKRGKGDWPVLDRENSVVVHPHEMANLINTLPRTKKIKSEASMDRNAGSILASTYAPSEIRDRHPLRFAKDFREYSPIQEEDESDVDEEGGKNHEKKQKRPSQDFGAGLEEPELKRLRKKQKRFPYARTLDPDEKVHDWLKNTSKQKAKQNTSSAETNPGANQMIITRPLPAFNQPSLYSKQSKTALNKDDKTPRTIRHSKRVVQESKSSIIITENKAKSLVEKLVKAPARSSQNVVGPGLGVSRENAFVEESF